MLRVTWVGNGPSLKRIGGPSPRQILAKRLKISEQSLRCRSATLHDGFFQL